MKAKRKWRRRGRISSSRRSDKIKKNIYTR